MATTRIDSDVIITGQLNVSGAVTAPISRSNIVLETAQVYPIPLVDFRVWNSFGSLLPGGAVADDLGLVNGAFSTFVPILQSLDLNALGAFQGYARAIVRLPRDYIAGQAIQIRAFAGMLSSVASVSASMDFAAYKSAGYNISSADLVNTSSQSINTISPTTFTYDLITTALSPGDTIDLRVELVGNSATASSHFAFCNDICLLYNAR